jgi:hypothetical protein
MAVRKYGWTPKGNWDEFHPRARRESLVTAVFGRSGSTVNHQGPEPTVFIAMRTLAAAKDGHAQFDEMPTPADFDTVREALTHVNTLRANPAPSDYERKLIDVCTKEQIDAREVGLACSAIGCLVNSRRRAQAQVQRAVDAATSQHVAQVGQRVDLKVIVTKVITLESEQYGTSFINLMRDEAGNVIVWKTSSWAGNEGQAYSIRGTVKANDEYKGTKQTVLTRCKVTEQEAGAAA